MLLVYVYKIQSYERTAVSRDGEIWQQPCTALPALHVARTFRTFYYPFNAKYEYLNNSCKNKQDRQCMYKVTLRRVRATKVAVEQQ